MGPTAGSSVDVSSELDAGQSAPPPHWRQKKSGSKPVYKLSAATYKAKAQMRRRSPWLTAKTVKVTAIDAACRARNRSGKSGTRKPSTLTAEQRQAARMLKKRSLAWQCRLSAGPETVQKNKALAASWLAKQAQLRAEAQVSEHVLKCAIKPSHAAEVKGETLDCEAIIVLKTGHGKNVLELRKLFLARREQACIEWEPAVPTDWTHREPGFEVVCDETPPSHRDAKCLLGLLQVGDPQQAPSRQRKPRPPPVPIPAPANAGEPPARQASNFAVGTKRRGGDGSSEWEVDLATQGNGFIWVPCASGEAPRKRHHGRGRQS